MSESAGIGGDPAIMVPVGPANATSAFRLVRQGGAVDWDRDGTIDGGLVSADTNNEGGAGEVMVGHEDWSHLVFAFQESPTFRDRAHGGDEENE